jgi:hypothetical protein
MRRFHLFVLSAMLVFATTSAQAAQISGEYLESRTCDVWTGPCFGNAQMGLSGKEALLAWKVDEGTWNGVRLDGLGVALVVNAESTIGSDGVFPMQAGKTKSVILVDQKADEKQHAALVDFVKVTAGNLTGTVAAVTTVPIELTNDHLEGKGVFKAGDVAEIETRKLASNDCVCTNEIAFYQPLIEIENSSPAYSKTNAFHGDGLNNKWTAKNQRSAYLGTFRR